MLRRLFDTASRCLRRRRAKKLWASYVSPELVEAILARPRAELPAAMPPMRAVNAEFVLVVLRDEKSRGFRER
jgi:hypothetical protein